MNTEKKRQLEEINNHPIFELLKDGVDYDTLSKSPTFRSKENDLISKVYSYVLEDYSSYSRIFGQKNFSEMIMMYASYSFEVVKACLNSFKSSGSSFYSYFSTAFYNKVNIIYAAESREQLCIGSMSKEEGLAYSKIKKYFTAKGISYNSFEDSDIEELKRLKTVSNLSDEQLYALIKSINSPTVFLDDYTMACDGDSEADKYESIVSSDNNGDITDTIIRKETVMEYIKKANAVWLSRQEKVKQYLSVRFTTQICEALDELELFDEAYGFDVIDKPVCKSYRKKECVHKATCKDYREIECVNNNLCKDYRRLLKMNEVSERFSNSKNPAGVWSKFCDDLQNAKYAQ